MGDTEAGRKRTRSELEDSKVAVVKLEEEEEVEEEDDDDEEEFARQNSKKGKIEDDSSGNTMDQEEFSNEFYLKMLHLLQTIVETIGKLVEKMESTNGRKAVETAKNIIATTATATSTALASASFILSADEVASIRSNSTTTEVFGVNLMMKLFTLDELTDPDVNVTGRAIAGEKKQMRPLDEARMNEIRHHIYNESEGTDLQKKLIYRRVEKAMIKKMSVLKTSKRQRSIS